MALEEIVVPDSRPQGELCPHCNVPVRFGQVPCPDGNPGCAVLHKGWQCPQCHRQYRKVEAQKP